MPAPTPAEPSFEDTLRTVPVAHETPRSAEYKRAFNVTFAIDATGDTTAADALPGRGVIEESEAKVSGRVEVRLSGAAFSIVAASPPVQTLSPMTENTWRWSVTPLSAGDHDLVFEVFAIDSGAVTPLRTFQDTVTVKVSGLNRAIAFADQANPLFVLLGGLGSALLEFCNDNLPRQTEKIARVGLPDRFADQYGNQNTLLTHMGVSVETLCDAMRQQLARA